MVIARLTDAARLEQVQADAVVFLVSIGEVELGLRLARASVAEVDEAAHPAEGFLSAR